MKQQRIRLINPIVQEPSKSVPCALCKFGLPVDARHNRYYCGNPDKKSGIHYGQHSCGNGEQRT